MRIISDFKFVVLKDEVLLDGDLLWYERLILQWKIAIKRFTASPVKWFELPSNEVMYETIPLTTPMTKTIPMKRID